MGEVQFKPVRMLRISVTDPSTGRSVPKLVWYLVYRVIPRDYSELAGDDQNELRRQLHDEATDPQNDVETVRAPKLMMPRFVLEVNDQGSEARYVDQPSPEIQQAIMRREFRGDAARLPVFNSVDGIMEVPEPVSIDDPDQLAKAVYGVAIWSDVDPDTDYFKVEMTGFTNAYRLPPGQGDTSVEEKIFVQYFGRPGDSIDPNEAEFRFDDEHPSEWIYRKRDAALEVDPSTLSVLRRGTVDGVTR